MVLWTQATHISSFPFSCHPDSFQSSHLALACSIEAESNCIIPGWCDLPSLGRSAKGSFSMHINEFVRLESQAKDNLARKLFCEAFQQPWPEEEPESPGFHLPVDRGGHVAGEMHCTPVFSWHTAAFLPTQDSFPHSFTHRASYLPCSMAKRVTGNGSFCLESIPSGAFSQSMV